jgi:hypothetical protein
MNLLEQTSYDNNEPPVMYTREEKGLRGQTHLSINTLTNQNTNQATDTLYQRLFARITA